MTTDLWRHQTRTPRPDGRLAPPAPQVAPRDTATPPPAPRSRPEHHGPHVTTQRLPSGFVMPLAELKASAPPKPPHNPCFCRYHRCRTPKTAAPMQRLFYAPAPPRTQPPFRSHLFRPHDQPATTLHYSRLALRLRVRNTRFHDTYSLVILSIPAI